MPSGRAARGLALPGVLSLGVPIVRIIIYWEFYWGPFMQGNYNICQTNKRKDEPSKDCTKVFHDARMDNREGWTTGRKQKQSCPVEASPVFNLAPHPCCEKRITSVYHDPSNYVLSLSLSFYLTLSLSLSLSLLFCLSLSLSNFNPLPVPATSKPLLEAL